MILTFCVLAIASPHPSIESVISKTRLICYSPSEFNPKAGALPSAESIREDMATVRPYFSGIITYGVKDDPHGFIPQIAQELDFRTVILGIWDPKSTHEIHIAIEQARKYPIVAAICVGNEGLHFNRYSLQDVTDAIQNIRTKRPHIPITTTEPLPQYQKNPELLQIVDFHLPNIHPYWSLTDRNPSHCANWVIQEAKRLQATAPTKKPLIIKESGFPSNGDPTCSPEIQAEFWMALFELMQMQNEMGFAFFEAFDPRDGWKANEMGYSVESHWGLWTQNRQPKTVIERLPQLSNERSQSK